MSEIELALLKDGYPLLDESDNGPCCEDDATDDYQCAWTIEKVELPEMPLGGLDGGVSGEPGGSDIGGVLGTLDDLQKGNTQQQAGGTQELAGLMEGVGAGSIATMAMSLVYPALKPMLEASIRKVTVTVSWKEGVRERSFGATQYLTSPAQGGLDPLAAEGLAESLDGLVPGAGGGGS
jgi:general secretion pathway protein I